MYFEIEDYKPDITPVGSVISWREGILLSIIVHLLLVVLMLMAPRWFPPDLDALRRRQEALALREKSPDTPQFVFVQPRVDLKALKPPERAEPSDQDRQARSPERAANPANAMPLSRGNTSQRVEQMEPEVTRGRGPLPDPATAPQTQAAPETPQPSSDNPLRLPESQSAMQLPAAGTAGGPRPLVGGALGESLRNLQRYVQQDQFQNPQGGGAFGPAIQFDTKGVEFGPWIRRFIAQVKRNWEPLIPLSAMSMKGHVVVTFNVHRDGRISDLTVVGPCPIDAFNTAAYGALASSNPTVSLPPEYPADKAFFTVTFFYNEEPQ